MNKIRKLHKRAMELAEHAFLSKHVGNVERSLQFYRKAYEKEAQAARMTLREAEPVRSVFYRSAATLAIACGELKEARILIREGLDGKPPTEIRDELMALLCEVDEEKGDNDEE